MYVRLNGKRLFFDIVSSGLVGKGDTMLELPLISVLHGSYLDHTYLKPPLASLQQDYQLLYYDYRGAGRSDRANPSSWRGIEQQADDFVALLDHLGAEQTLIFAHSWGCHVASMLTVKYPERINACILTNPAIFNLKVFQQTLVERSGQEAAELAEELIQKRKLDKFPRYLELLGPLLFRNPPPAELFPRTRASLEFFMQTLDELLGYDLLAALHKQDKPSLVLSGIHDPYAQTDNSALLREALTRSQAEIHAYEDSAHFVFLDEAQRTLRDITDFLNRQSSPESALVSHG